MGVASSSDLAWEGRWALTDFSRRRLLLQTDLWRISRLLESSWNHEHRRLSGNND
jgi:hypothetical protein